MNLLRIMTYNVHGCVGTDGRLAPERIVQVIRDSRPDVVALQELDVEQVRSSALDQPAWLAAELGMQFEFVSARVCGGGHYGNAVLSRFPLHGVRQACFPRWAKCEPRAIQAVDVELPSGKLHVLNTHLGLRRRERLAQVEALLDGGWLDREPRRTLLCGDLNAWPGSRVHRSLCTVLRDAQLAWLGARPRSTWPSRWPVMRIDHVLLSADLRVERCLVPKGNLVHRASDHLPLIVDLVGVLN